MRRSFVSEILQEDIVRRSPRAAPAVKTERKDNCVAYFLHSSAQMCSYHTPGLRQPHITAVFFTLWRECGPERLTGVRR